MKLKLLQEVDPVVLYIAGGILTLLLLGGGALGWYYWTLPDEQDQGPPPAGDEGPFVLESGTLPKEAIEALRVVLRAQLEYHIRHADEALAQPVVGAPTNRAGRIFAPWSVLREETYPGPDGHARPYLREGDPAEGSLFGSLHYVKPESGEPQAYRRAAVCLQADAPAPPFASLLWYRIEMTLDEADGFDTAAGRRYRSFRLLALPRAPFWQEELERPDPRDNEHMLGYTKKHRTPALLVDETAVFRYDESGKPPAGDAPKVNEVVSAP